MTTDSYQNLDELTTLVQDTSCFIANKISTFPGRLALELFIYNLEQAEITFIKNNGEEIEFFGNKFNLRGESNNVLNYLRSKIGETLTLQFYYKSFTEKANQVLN